MFASVMTQVLAQQDDQFCRFSATTKVLQRGRRNQNLGNSQRNNNFAKKKSLGQWTTFRAEENMKKKMKSMQRFQKFTTE